MQKEKTAAVCVGVEKDKKKDLEKKIQLKRTIPNREASYHCD
jgi:hypothetical protein